MGIRATILTGVLSLPLVTAAAFAADTGNPSLVDAAKKGDRAAVRSILDGSAKADAVSTQGSAALIWAAARNDKELVDLLLSAGVDPNGTNDYGAAALYAAAAENADVALIKKLLGAGSNVNAALMSGETALMQASRLGNLETVRALLAAGGDPNRAEKNGGQTALMWAAAERHPQVTKELVANKADVNAQSKTGFTALMFAARGDAESARILLAGGADPNVATKDWGQTALIIASTMGQTDVVEALVNKGADPNLRDKNGYVALLSAVRDSQYGEDAAQRAAAVATVKVLVKHGADPNIRLHQEGKSTAQAPNEVTLEGVTAVALAAEVNNLEAIKVLVEAGADPNIPNANGMTPLIFAAGGGTDEQRPRPLDERAMAVHTARYLVEHGADVNAAGDFGWTALHMAAYQAYDDVIEYLVSKGAKTEVFDQLGQTPLSASMAILTKEAGARRLQIPRRFHKDTAELLLKLGAVPLNKSGVNVVFQRTGDEVGQE
jgi:ankyrin repeat protein